MPPRKAYIQADTVDGMVQFALQGLGIVEAPDLTSVYKSGLKEVLPDLIGPPLPYYFIYHKNRKVSKKIDLLLKYLLTIGK